MWAMGGREADSAPVNVRKWAGAGVANFGPDIMLVLFIILVLRLSLCFLLPVASKLKVCLVAGFTPGDAPCISGSYWVVL